MIMAKRPDSFFNMQFITSSISTTLVLLLLGMVVFFVLSANNLSTYVRENIGFTILVSDDMKEPEALKFQIESVRLSEICTGILWWNAIDGWPQSSDAVVDYYYRKKLAYYYIKRSQSPFLICCTEPNPWESKITALNDAYLPAEGTYEVTDPAGKVLLSGSFSIPPFSRRILGALRSPRASNQLWLIKWRNNDGTGCNHYISGNRYMELDWYMKNLPYIAKLDNSFEADKMGC